MRSIVSLEAYLLLGSHDMLVAASTRSRRAHLAWIGPQAGPGNYGILSSGSKSRCRAGIPGG